MKQRTILALATLALAACGGMAVNPDGALTDAQRDDAADASPIPDAELPSDAEVPPDDVITLPDAGTCTSLTATGPEVSLTPVPGDLSPFTGGAIADGTYDLTAARRYGSAGGDPTTSIRSALRIAGNQIELVQALPGAGATNETAGTFTTTGTTLAITQTCPFASSAMSAMYSASATELQIGNSADGMVLVFTHR
jgi:hypothetical protein